MRREHLTPWVCRFLAIVGLCLVAACGVSIRPSAVPEAVSHGDNLAEARQFAQQAANESRPKWSARAAVRCAAAAYRAADTDDWIDSHAAIALSTTCTGKLLDILLHATSKRWTSTTMDIAGVPLTVEWRDMSPSLAGAVQLIRADKVILPRSIGPRAAAPGYGIALVAMTARCNDRPLCELYPPEGVFRPATAWVEADADGRPRLVLSDPVAHPSVVIGSRSYPLSMDLTAPYAMLIKSSRLNRLAVWNLLGGKQIGLRQGLYLLQDYDPDKTPIVMVHGLGASPLIWGHLTNLILNAPDLRARYQIWHVVYQTNAPVLVDRLRVQQFMDKAWRLVDPDGKDPARHGMVLIGHSMGGVVARLLVSNSHDVLWNAASTVPINQIHGSADDQATIQSVFYFTPYPGVSKAIFLAAPHLGSPASDDFIGRLAKWVVTPHAPELDALRRFADTNSATIPHQLLAEYRKDGLSSISTLSTNQPVSHAAHALMPASGIRYYTIVGSLPGASVPGDGVVPLSSAILPGAESTTIVTSGHKVYNNNEALGQIIKILREFP
jgi:pimeloyl-ACP methyl ester carboxylesterase